MTSNIKVGNLSYEDFKDHMGFSSDTDFIWFLTGQKHYDDVMFDGKPVKYILSAGAGIDLTSDGTTYTILQVGYEYLRVEYSHYSYCGFDFEDMGLLWVVPVEKTIVVYE